MLPPLAQMCHSSNHASHPTLSRTLFFKQGRRAKEKRKSGQEYVENLRAISSNFMHGPYAGGGASLNVLPRAVWL
jgi:hypothetical protein